MPFSVNASAFVVNLLCVTAPLRRATHRSTFSMPRLGWPFHTEIHKPELSFHAKQRRDNIAGSGMPARSMSPSVTFKSASREFELAWHLPGYFANGEGFKNPFGRMSQKRSCDTEFIDDDP